MSEEQVKQEQAVESNTQETQQQDTQARPFEIPTEAQEFVGEGKKYKSVDDALRSVPHAQEHIKTLEEEMAHLKEELAKRRTTEELLDEIKSGIQPQEATTSTSEINQDRIMDLVNQTLQQREKLTKAQTNARSVADKFTEKYGSKAEEVYNTLAKESGMTLEQLHNLSATSPNVVLKLAGFDNRATTVAKSQSTVNTESLSNNKATDELSARVPKGASTKDMLNAWKIAGEKVKRQLNN